MNSTVGSESVRSRALEVVMRSLDFDRLLPDDVFIGSWDSFLFCESDRIFAPEFSDAMSHMLRLECAQVACFLNIDATQVFELSHVAALFLGEETTAEQYDNALRAGGPAGGWLYRFDRYICASDIGEWCIYCEKGNDVALIGIRDASGLKKFEAPLQKLWAKPIENLVDGGDSPLSPFNQLTPAWRAGLMNNYGRARNKR